MLRGMETDSWLRSQLSRTGPTALSQKSHSTLLYLLSVSPTPAPLFELFDRADVELFERVPQLESFKTVLSVPVNDRRSGSITPTKSRSRSDI